MFYSRLDIIKYRSANASYTRTISSWHGLVKSVDFHRTIRQFCPQHSTRVCSSIDSKVPIRLEGQLVDIEIDVTICTNGGTIRPQDSRISEETVSLTVTRVKVVPVSYTHLTLPTKRIV